MVFGGVVNYRFGSENVRQVKPGTPCYTEEQESNQTLLGLCQKDTEPNSKGLLYDDKN